MGEFTLGQHCFHDLNKPKHQLVDICIHMLHNSLTGRFQDSWRYKQFWQLSLLNQSKLDNLIWRFLKMNRINIYDLNIQLLPPSYNHLLVSVQQQWTGVQFLVISANKLVLLQHKFLKSTWLINGSFHQLLQFTFEWTTLPVLIIEGSTSLLSNFSNSHHCVNSLAETNSALISDQKKKPLNWKKMLV